MCVDALVNAANEDLHHVGGLKRLHQNGSHNHKIIMSSNFRIAGIERNLKHTLPSVSVVQITRIENKWLWERFALHKKQLAFKNDGNVNESSFTGPGVMIQSSSMRVRMVLTCATVPKECGG